MHWQTLICGLIIMTALSHAKNQQRTSGQSGKSLYITGLYRRNVPGRYGDMKTSRMLGTSRKLGKSDVNKVYNLERENELKYEDILMQDKQVPGRYGDDGEKQDKTDHKKGVLLNDEKKFSKKQDVPGRYGRKDQVLVPLVPAKMYSRKDEKNIPGRYGGKDEKIVPGRYGRKDETIVPGRYGRKDQMIVPGRYGRKDEKIVPGRYGRKDETIVPGRYGRKDEKIVPGRYGRKDETIVPGKYGRKDETIVPGRYGRKDETIVPGRYGRKDETIVPGRYGRKDEKIVPGRYGDELVPGRYGDTSNGQVPSVPWGNPGKARKDTTEKNPMEWKDSTAEKQATASKEIEVPGRYGDEEELFAEIVKEYGRIPGRYGDENDIDKVPGRYGDENDFNDVPGRYGDDKAEKISNLLDSNTVKISDLPGRYGDSKSTKISKNAQIIEKKQFGSARYKLFKKKGGRKDSSSKKTKMLF